MSRKDDLIVVQYTLQEMSRQVDDVLSGGSTRFHRTQERLAAALAAAHRVVKKLEKHVQEEVDA